MSDITGSRKRERERGREREREREKERIGSCDVSRKREAQIPNFVVEIGRREE